MQHYSVDTGVAAAALAAGLRDEGIRAYPVEWPGRHLVVAHTDDPQIPDIAVQIVASARLVTDQR